MNVLRECTWGIRLLFGKKHSFSHYFRLADFSEQLLWNSNADLSAYLVKAAFRAPTKKLQQVNFFHAEFYKQ